MRFRVIYSLAAAAAISALIPAAAPAATISSSTANPLLDEFVGANGPCSLREMLYIANIDNAAAAPECTVDTNGGANPLGNDTIQLGTGVYQLTIPLDGSPDIDDGDLEVEDTINADDGDLTIIGQGRANTAIDANGRRRWRSGHDQRPRLRAQLRDGQAGGPHGPGRAGDL